MSKNSAPEIIGFLSQEYFLDNDECEHMCGTKNDRYPYLAAVDDLLALLFIYWESSSFWILYKYVKHMAKSLPKNDSI